MDIDNFRVVPSQLQSTLATLTECRRFWFPSRRALWLSLCLSAGFRPAAEAQPPIGSVFARGVHGCAYEQHCWQGSSWHSWRIIHKGQVAECVPNSTSGSSRTAHKKKAARIPDSTTLTPTDTCSLQLADAHSSVRMCQKACAISMNKLKYHLRTRLNAGVAKEDLVRRRFESCDSSSSCFTKAVVVLIAVILHEDQQ